MLILSDLYRAAINVGERALSPGMKKVFGYKGFVSLEIKFIAFIEFRLSNGK
jgi:hypothetical protein